MNIGPGELDRRIEFHENVGTRDAAGDPGFVWTLRFKRWARFITPRRILVESNQPQVTLRDSDIDWLVRQDPQTRIVAPENWSIFWRGQRYYIVGVIPSPERLDGFHFRTSVRPDRRGSAVDTVMTDGPA